MVSIHELVAEYFDARVAGKPGRTRQQLLEIPGLTSGQRETLKARLNDVDDCVVALRGNAQAGKPVSSDVAAALADLRSQRGTPVAPDHCRA